MWCNVIIFNPMVLLINPRVTFFTFALLWNFRVFVPMGPFAPHNNSTHWGARGVKMQRRKSRRDRMSAGWPRHGRVASWLAKMGYCSEFGGYLNLLENKENSQQKKKNKTKFLVKPPICENTPWFSRESTPVCWATFPNQSPKKERRTPPKIWQIAKRGGETHRAIVMGERYERAHPPKTNFGGLDSWIGLLCARFAKEADMSWGPRGGEIIGGGVQKPFWGGFYGMCSLPLSFHPPLPLFERRGSKATL